MQPYRYRVHDTTGDDLGTLGGREAAAADINNQGQIVGQSDTRQKDDYGAIWHASSGR